MAGYFDRLLGNPLFNAGIGLLGAPRSQGWAGGLLGLQNAAQFRQQQTEQQRAEYLYQLQLARYQAEQRKAAMEAQEAERMRAAQGVARDAIMGMGATGPVSSAGPGEYQGIKFSGPLGTTGQYQPMNEAQLRYTLMAGGMDPNKVMPKDANAQSSEAERLIAKINDPATPAPLRKQYEARLSKLNYIAPQTQNAPTSAVPRLFKMPDGKTRTLLSTDLEGMQKTIAEGGQVTQIYKGVPVVVKSQDQRQWLLDKGTNIATEIGTGIQADAATLGPLTTVGAPTDFGQRRPVPNSFVEGVRQNETNLFKLREISKAVSGLPNAMGINPDTKATGFRGYVPDAVLQRTDPEGIQVRAQLADIKSMVIKQRSGLAQTVAEMENLKPFLPKDTDDPATIKKKLPLLIAAIEAEQEAIKSSFPADQGWMPLTAEIGAGGAQGTGGAALEEALKKYPD